MTRHVQRPARRFLTAAMALGIVAATIALGPTARAEEPIGVPRPEVTPLTGEGVRTGGPMSAYPYPDRLAAAGFVEEEFQVAGTASRLVGTTWGAPAPFATRVLVRRPADDRAFNGSVMLEWLNVTTGVGVPVDWAWYEDEVLREGYAYVGVDAQAVGVAALKAWDPVRYAGLVHPGDDYSYDILAQVAQAFRRPGDVDLIGGLSVEQVYAGGSSQSCSRLNDFLTSVHPIVERVIDGFLPSVCAGTLRTSLDVPVLRINSLNEVSATVPQEDFASYRLWEVAGAAHSDKDWAVQARAAGARDWGDPTNTFPLIPSDYDRPDKTCFINRFPKKYAYRAGLHALDVWARTGAAAPPAPRVDRDANGARRDELGNASGGLRLPAIEVPTAAHNNGLLDCEVLQGRTDPFTEEQLHQLYPTRASYVSAVNAAAERAVGNGWLRPADAAEVRKQAKSFAWAYVWFGDPGPAALTPDPTGWIEEHS